MKIHIVFHKPDLSELVQFSPVVPSNGDFVWLEEDSDDYYQVSDVPHWVFERNELKEVHIYLNVIS